MIAWRRALGASLVCSIACTPSTTVPTPAPSSSSSSSAIGDTRPAVVDASWVGAAPEDATAIAGEEPLISLTVAGFAAAVVAAPLGRTDRRPVIVAAHGNYDRPEWQCETWRRIVGDEAFVLCPRGLPRPDSPSRDDIRFTYGNHDAFVAELQAGLVALRAKYPAHVADGPLVYVGFSLGAIHGSRILTRNELAIERAVLVEGGHDPWTAETARAFAKKGGKRILFACGQPGCVKSSERVRALLARENVDAAIVFANEGHSYTAGVAKKIDERYRWFVEGDTRFDRVAR